MLFKIVERFFDWFFPARKVRIIKGDELPENLPKQDLVLVQDAGENWSVGLYCPCGCGATIELMLLQNVSPRWDIQIDWMGRPTLSPSVWRNVGCKAHFWVKAGKIIWCP